MTKFSSCRKYYINSTHKEKVNDPKAKKHFKTHYRVIALGLPLMLTLLAVLMLTESTGRAYSCYSNPLRPIRCWLNLTFKVKCAKNTRIQLRQKGIKIKYKILQWQYCHNAKQLLYSCIMVYCIHLKHYFSLDFEMWYGLHMWKHDLSQKSHGFQPSLAAVVMHISDSIETAWMFQGAFPRVSSKSSIYVCVCAELSVTRRYTSTRKIREAVI